MSRMVGGGFSFITGLRTAPQKKSAPFSCWEMGPSFSETSIFFHHYRRSLQRTNQCLPGKAVANVTFRHSDIPFVQQRDPTDLPMAPFLHFVLPILH